jgi:hypothetical protein
MRKDVKMLLAADSVINLILGLLLLLFPSGIMNLLGLPPTNTFFYSSILGGVIFGIGLALAIEWLSEGKTLRGLGLAGAILINLCGGGTLLFWLLFMGLALPLKGYITLWIVAVVVVGIGLVELFSGAYREINGRG